MQVNDILKLSAIFVGEEELAQANLLCSGENEDDEETIKKVKKLEQCLQFVHEDISRDYMPLIADEDITFENGKFEYKNLSKAICDIIKLQSTNGLAIRYKCYPTYIKADVKKAVLTFTYLPQKPVIGGEISDYSDKLSERIIAYGVAMEYLFLNSLSDEAAVWETRFLNSLENALRKKSNIIMPRRRWM